MMIKNIMHLHQHMEMGPLIFTVILYQLFSSPTQIHFKVCWWITQLQIWVALMIIRMMHYVPKQWGEMVSLPLFSTFPNVSLSIKNIFTVTRISEARLKSLYSRLGFKVIKDFATSTNSKKDQKRFNYE